MTGSTVGHRLLFLKTHLIWRHLCSHTHPSPQVWSGLMGTDLVDPSGWLGGPIQSFWSYMSMKNTRLKVKCSTSSIILSFLPFRWQCGDSIGSLTSPWLLRKDEPACMLQPSCGAWSPRKSQWLPHQHHVLSGCHGYQWRQTSCHQAWNPNPLPSSCTQAPNRNQIINACSSIKIDPLQRQNKQIDVNCTTEAYL